MSEEEKKAIEYIEQFIGIEKQYKYKPIKIKTLTNTRQAITTILNLIEKQQKEIEKLKIEITKNDYVDLDKLALNYRLYKDLAYSYQGNSISKDKIKAKIEEINKQIEEIRKENREKSNATKYDYLIVGKRDGLQELLEE